MTPSKESNANDFLWLALYAFSGLGMEILLVWIETRLFGTAMANFSTWQMLTHWLLTIAIWMIMAILLIHLAKRQHNFALLEQRDRPKPSHIIASIGIALALIIALSIAWQGFKPWLELQRLGAVKFVFQYLYYAAEVVLITLIIVFGQEAGERALKHRALPSFIPWGGIVLGLTWGLIHILTQNNLGTGILSFFSAIAFGVIYLLLNKNVFWAYGFIAIVFML